MSKEKGHHEDKEPRKPVPGPGGTEDDLFLFFSSLIEQNAQLAGRVDEIDSLKKLAEETLAEAKKAAEVIKTEAEKKAKDDAAAIVARVDAEAKATAQDIVDKAKEKAEAEAHGIISEAKLKAEAAERKAHEIMSAAAEKAESAKRKAEEEASRVIAEAKKRAEEDARSIRQEAERMLKTSRKATEAEAKTKHGEDIEEEGEAPRPKGQAPRGLERAEGETLGLYDKSVELIIMPPVGLAQLQKLRKHLREISQIRILELRGSVDSGVRMRLLLRAVIPLLNILADLPEVQKASDMPVEGGRVHPERQKGQPLRRIAVTMKR